MLPPYQGDGGHGVLKPKVKSQPLKLVYITSFLTPQTMEQLKKATPTQIVDLVHLGRHTAVRVLLHMCVFGKAEAVAAVLNNCLVTPDVSSILLRQPC